MIYCNITEPGGERLLPGSPEIFCQRRLSSRARWSVNYQHDDNYYDDNDDNYYDNDDNYYDDDDNYYNDGDNYYDDDDDNDGDSIVDLNDNGLQTVKADLLTRRRLETTTGELRCKCKST